MSRRHEMGCATDPGLRRKGRDLYDLGWYLAARTWPAPNLALLNAALAQTGWKGPALTARNWRDEIRQRIEALDWGRARADARPFLERERDIAMVTVEALGSLLGSGTQSRGD
jgi:hypothetical protein